MHKNAMQWNARIESKSILVSHCIVTSVNMKAIQRNMWCSIVLQTDFLDASFNKCNEILVI